MKKFTEIMEIMEDARKKFFTDKGIDTDKHIWYLNSDGTDLTWLMLGKTCRFNICLPEPEEGNLEGVGNEVIRFEAFADGGYELTVWNNENDYVIFECKGKLSFNVHNLVCRLHGTFDSDGIWCPGLLEEHWNFDKESYLNEYMESRTKRLVSSL